MSWRLARSLDALRDEVNAVAPRRNKRMDGTIGDTAHSKRKSDHNPNRAGVVCAIDLTHDPRGGLDCHDLTERIRQRCAIGDERRVAYIIWNRRIASSRQSWAWRPYHGSNPHDKHAHISVRQDPTYYDSPAPWGWRNAAIPSTEEDEVTDADLKRIVEAVAVRVDHALQDDFQVRDAEQKEQTRILREILAAVEK